MEICWIFFFACFLWQWKSIPVQICFRWWHYSSHFLGFLYLKFNPRQDNSWISTFNVSAKRYTRAIRSARTLTAEGSGPENGKSKQNSRISRGRRCPWAIMHSKAMSPWGFSAHVCCTLFSVLALSREQREPRRQGRVDSHWNIARGPSGVTNNSIKLISLGCYVCARMSPNPVNEFSFYQAHHGLISWHSSWRQKVWF